MQVYNLIICGYFCFGFFDFILKGKSLQDYKNLFSPKEYEKNVKIILNYFSKYRTKMKKIYCVTLGKYRKFKNLKMSFIFLKNISYFY